MFYRTPANNYTVISVNRIPWGILLLNYAVNMSLEVFIKSGSINNQIVCSTVAGECFLFGEGGEGTT